MSYVPDAEAGRRVVFLRGLEMMASLGIHPQEKVSPQRVLVSVELLVADDAAPHDVGEDDLRRVVDYERIVNSTREIVSAGHVLLVETLAERIALAALADSRVERVRVTVEKPDIFPDVQTVGVVVERRRG